MKVSRKCTLPEFCLLFTVLVIRQGIAGDAFGLDMYEAQRDGEELPQIDADLPAGMEKLQELINDMTSYKPKSRPSSMKIQSRLRTINAEVNMWHTVKYL